MYKDMYECMHVRNDVGRVCMYVEVYVRMHKDMHEHMRGCKDVGEVCPYVDVLYESRVVITRNRARRASHKLDCTGITEYVLLVIRAYA
ncbi:hypothetical protein HanPSC8_Chr13g0585681 [Helianthus annuus]|nr:hypothetical protein HanPSC8_Chr13g0585681 [Helianthus annuus]